MKFTLSWLKKYLETDASLDEICVKLTAIGLEVEGVEDKGLALRPFIVAQVESCEIHPNADKLHVCTVNTGVEKLQVVCGAPNVRVGLKTVFAKEGTIIPSVGQELKKCTIRGVPSNGMMCSEKELLIF